MAEDIAKAIGAVLGLIIVVFLRMVIVTWAWNMFMPMVFGLTDIGLLHGLAFSLLISSLRSNINWKKEE